MTEDLKEKLEPSRRQQSSESPGALLREARCAKKLTCEEVAKQLRLSVSCIKDIEHDQYANAVALIYVRGYLRSYARLVDLSPDRVVAALEQFGLEDVFNRDRSDDKVVKHQTVQFISRSSRMVNGRRIARWITSSAILLLVVLVGVWWQGQKKHGIDQQHQAAVDLQTNKQTVSLQPSATPSTSSAEPSTDISQNQTSTTPSTTTVVPTAEAQAPAPIAAPSHASSPETEASPPPSTPAPAAELPKVKPKSLHRSHVHHRKMIPPPDSSADLY